MPGVDSTLRSAEWDVVLRDGSTAHVKLYLESFGNPRTFGRLARHVGRTKPIVAIKAGRSTAGRRAAGSHTGAIASSDVLVDGLFRQAGIVRVNTLEEMFDVAALLAHQPAPAGPRLGILTNAGGAGILAADMAESHGLQVPVVSDATRETLHNLLPAAATVGNPVDLLASASAEHYESALELLLADPVIDSVLAIFVPPIVTDPTAVATAIASAACASSGKPVATVFMRAADTPRELGAIPCYRFPEAAALAIARATAYGEWRRRPQPGSETPLAINRARLRSIVDRALEGGGGWLSPDDSQTVLQACGISTLQSATVSTESEAVEHAEAIGFPVAVKAVGPELLHKSEVGGVHLGLSDRNAVSAASCDLRRRLGDKLTGLLVQRMAPAGVELLVGLVDDDLFGPVVVCGPGGTMVELLGPPAARLLPLTDTDVDDLLREMPGRALLTGHRGQPPADEPALRRLLHQVSALADCCPEILELDLNPVRVHAHGLSILDVRMRVGRQAPPSGSRRIAY